jgi:hypothetical protein
MLRWLRATEEASSIDASGSDIGIHGIMDIASVTTEFGMSVELSSPFRIPATRLMLSLTWA